MSKPKLTIDGQIEHMKSKGIRFHIVDEAAARDFLLNNNYYFKIKSYTKNYDKYTATDKKGQYINLEFAYLQELSKMDMYLRRLLFDIVIDIEHFAKVQLLADLAENTQENGYAIITAFFSKYPHIQPEIAKHSTLSYSHDLIEKYKEDFAAWNIVEVLTFNNFILLYQLYYQMYPGQKNLSNFLWSAKSLRNAIAHNNCLLNKLNPAQAAPIKKNKQLNAVLSKLPIMSDTMRQKKMALPFLNDFFAALYLFNTLVTSEDIKQHRMETLADLLHNRFQRHADYFKTNQHIASTLEFMQKIIDYYHKNRI